MHDFGDPIRGTYKYDSNAGELVFVPDETGELFLPLKTVNDAESSSSIECTPNESTTIKPPSFENPSLVSDVDDESYIDVSGYESFTSDYVEPPEEPLPSFEAFEAKYDEYVEKYGEFVPI